MVLIFDEKQKFSAFHMAFIAGTKITNTSTHSNNLSDLFSNWRVMLTHRNTAEFQKTAEMKYRVLKRKKTWKIINKTSNQHAILLKWVFTYKCDANNYFIKHKTRLVVRGHFQELNDQNVYVAILIFKMFRTLITLIATFKFETKQLNAVNAFFNVHNNEVMYCYFFDDYK